MEEPTDRSGCVVMDPSFVAAVLSVQSMGWSECVVLFS